MLKKKLKSPKKKKKIFQKIIILNGNFNFNISTLAQDAHFEKDSK